MKHFILKYKLHIFAAGILAVSQVSFIAGNTNKFNRFVAEVASGTATETQTVSRGGLDIVTDVTRTQIEDNGSNQIIDGEVVGTLGELTSQRKRAIMRAFNEKAVANFKSCLFDIDAMKDLDELKDDYLDDKSTASLEALEDELVDLELLEPRSQANATYEDELKLDDFESSSDSDRSSDSPILDEDSPDDYDKIAECHEYKIKKLDSDSAKRKYFEDEVEEKFKKILAETSDSNEVRTLAQNFISLGQEVDPSGALGMQNTALLHSSYAQIIADAKILRAQGMSEQDIQLRLSTAFANLKTKAFTLSSQNPSSLSVGTINQISTFWEQQAGINSLSPLGGLGSTTTAGSLLDDPLGTGLNTIPGATTLPGTGSIPNQNPSQQWDGTSLMIPAGPNRTVRNGGFDPSQWTGASPVVRNTPPVFGTPVTSN